MADHYFVNLEQAMDRLWFHQIILFSEPIPLNPNTIKITTQQPISESPFNSPSSHSSSTQISEEEISSGSSSIPSKDDFNDEDEEKLRYNKEREIPTRLELVTSKTRSYSLSPSTKKRQVRRLQKSMSCKSLFELEYEEVKGFIDLGFTFEKEQLSPRMMSVLPGLQRIGEYYNETEEEEEKRGVTRPYLSEAWLIKRPDSPLLNLRLPRVFAAADMKKHLRFWARTVASEIQQES